jgi:GDP-L-fucose synthase
MDVRPRPHHQDQRGAVSGAVFVTGHRGLLGSALLRALAGREIITATRAELDLRDAAAVEQFIAARKPATIIHAAARNAGVLVQVMQPEGMLTDNMDVALNVIRAAARCGVKRLLYVASAAIFPEWASAADAKVAAGVPFGPTGGYALAKIAGMKLCAAVRAERRFTYHSICPCNLYGPGDNYGDAATVVAGMMRRMHRAAAEGDRVFKVWGSGRQTREFLHVEDAADACLWTLEYPQPPDHVNCGSGESVSMMALAVHLAEITGYTGTLEPDPSRPEGTPRPAVDHAWLREQHWQPRIALPVGLRATYAVFLAATAAGTLRE